MSDITIVYYTDNRLDEGIAKRCRELLVEAANGIPIISVSQKPVDLGVNICVGEIGRSWVNLYKQLFAGVDAAKTKYVATAEHDCIYSTEHYAWEPPRDDVFYYNDNCWLAQWHSNKPELDGMYSYWPKRCALSQLICNRDLLRLTIDRRLDYIDKDRRVARYIINAGEPGISRVRLETEIGRLQKHASSGKPVYLKEMLKKFGDILDLERAEMFRTKIPNLDIRHSANFTGPKRGSRRTWELEPWGKLADLMSVERRSDGKQSNRTLQQTRVAD